MYVYEIHFSLGEFNASTGLLLQNYDFYRAPCVMVMTLQWDNEH